MNTLRNIRKPSLFLIVFLGIVFSLGYTLEVEAGGLVQCGVDRDCTVCDLVVLARNVLNFILQLLAGVATLSIVIGGVMMILSAGSPNLYQQGITIIQYAAIGLIFAASVFLIFGFALTALGYQEAQFGQVIRFEEGAFFEVTCSTNSRFNSEGRMWGLDPAGESSEERPTQEGGSGTRSRSEANRENAARRQADAPPTNSDVQEGSTTTGRAGSQERRQ